MNNIIANDPINASPPVAPVKNVEPVVKAEIKKEYGAQNENRQQSNQQEADLNDVIKRTNKVASVYNNQITFEVVDEGDPPVVVIKNKESGEVVRTIPAEEMVKLNRKMQDLVGMIYNGSI